MLIFVDKFVMFCRETDGICTALVAVRFGAPMKRKQRTSMEEAATNFIQMHSVGNLIMHIYNQPGCDFWRK